MTDETRGLTHVGGSGEARMVDVSEKPQSDRRAVATGVIRMEASTLRAIEAAQMKKGDVIGTARIAGIMAAKKTSELIPLCHPIALTDVQIALTADATLPGLRCQASVRTTGKTGVEMEALTAVSVALLTVYDMAKAMDRGMTISDISLAEKSGGVHGDFSRVDGTGSAP